VTAAGAGDIFFKVFAVDLLGLVKRAFLKITSCQYPEIVGPGNITGATVFFNFLVMRGVFHLPDVAFDGFVPIFTGLKQSFLFGRFDHDGLQVFRAHNSPHAGSPGGMVPARHDAAKQGAVFSGRANGHNLQFVTAQLVFEVVIGLPGVQAPDRSCGANVYFVAVQPKINGFG